MIGSLVLIGEGKWSKRELEEALQRADRRTAGPTAPPEGLYFARVDY
jgi:tRNA pseudouridine38-40 synthase